MATRQNAIDPAVAQPQRAGGFHQRVTKVVKGGKNLSFRAGGDWRPLRESGGLGRGQRPRVSALPPIRKGSRPARDLRKDPRARDHDSAPRCWVNFATRWWLLKPAAEGTE